MFETKEMIQFSTKKVKMYGIPEKSKSDKGEPSYQKNIKNIAKAEYKNCILYTYLEYIRETER